jgi:hypothetical protein
MPECPICYSPALDEVKVFSFAKYNCPRCGPWMAHLDEDLLIQIFSPMERDRISTQTFTVKLHFETRATWAK